jgi:hypothetical protein
MELSGLVPGNSNKPFFETFYRRKIMSTTNRTFLTLAVVAMACFAFTGTSAQAALFADGSFESITGSADRNPGYTFGPWEIGNPLKATSFSQDQVYLRANNAGSASDGVDSITLYGGGRDGAVELFQAFDTTLGTTYTVTFDMKNASSQDVDIRVFEGLLPTVQTSYRSSIDLLDSNALGALNITDGTNAYQTHSFDFTAASATSTISFLGNTNSSGTSLLRQSLLKTPRSPRPRSSCSGMC